MREFEWMVTYKTGINDNVAVAIVEAKQHKFMPTVSDDGYLIYIGDGFAVRKDLFISANKVFEKPIDLL